MSTTKVKLSIESFELELQSMPVKAPPAPAKPKAKRTAWRDYDFDELLVAVEIGLPGAREAARRRADGDADMLQRIARALAEVRR